MFCFKQEGKSLASIVRQKQVGQTVTLKLFHKRDEKEVKVILQKAPKEQDKIKNPPLGVAI